MVPQYYTQLKKNDPDGSFDFKDAPPQGVLVYLGTNVRLVLRAAPTNHTETAQPPTHSPLTRPPPLRTGLLPRRVPRA